MYGHSSLRTFMSRLSSILTNKKSPTKSILDEHGLGVSEFTILAVINLLSDRICTTADSDGAQAVTVKSIVGFCKSVFWNTVTASCAILRDKGFLTEHRDDDGVVSYRLTQKALDMLASMEASDNGNAIIKPLFS